MDDDTMDVSFELIRMLGRGFFDQHTGLELDPKRESGELDLVTRRGPFEPRRLEEAVEKMGRQLFGVLRIDFPQGALTDT